LSGNPIDAVFNTAEFKFDGMAKGLAGQSLAYLVGLVDSPLHKISDPLIAIRILRYLYDIEEQASDSEALKKNEAEFFNRYFEGGYLPQTPCMVVKSWSPIGSLLERGYQPLILNRDNSRPHGVIATGIWEPLNISDEHRLETTKTTEQLFWAIIKSVSMKAREQRMWINLVAKPGWSYDSAISSLPNWSTDEVSNSGRVIWQRTPQG
jgi:hypothetical protein